MHYFLLYAIYHNKIIYSQFYVRHIYSTRNFKSGVKVSYAVNLQCLMRLV